MMKAAQTPIKKSSFWAAMAQEVEIVGCPDQAVEGSIASSSSPHLEVSLGKILNP